MTSYFLSLGSFALALCLSLPVGATSAADITGGGETISAVGVPSGPDDNVVALPGDVSTHGPLEYVPPPAVSAVETPPPSAPVISEMPAPVAPITAVTTTMPLPPMPSDTGLQTSPAQDAGLAITPLPGDTAGQSDATSVMGDTGTRPRHSGTYYDTHAVIPDKALSNSPRKVDPALEPGQKFVVVQKTGSANSIEAQYISATRALKLGRYAAAMEMFGKLYKQNPKDARILMGLALSQQSAGFNESAARTYEDLLSVQPNNASAIINLMGLMKSQYPSVTLTKLMELRSKYPDNVGIPAQIGLVNAQLKNYDDAVRYLEVAASMEPYNPDHMYNMAIIMDRKGNTSKAIEYYERALQIDASSGVSESRVDLLPREVIYDRLVVLRRKV